jgi:hypothetical protein
MEKSPIKKKDPRTKSAAHAQGSQLIFGIGIGNWREGILKAPKGMPRKLAQPKMDVEAKAESAKKEGEV